MNSFSHTAALTETRNWVEKFVIAHAICPFAGQPAKQGTIHYQVSEAQTMEALLEDLFKELQAMERLSPEERETTLVIHPWVLREFEAYNDFLEVVENLLMEHEWDGMFQVASFHPHYQFFGTQPEEAQNYTNRSPYPMLHIIREDSLDEVLENNPHAEQIPERNIALMESWGLEKIKALLTEINAGPDTASDESPS